MAIIPSITSWTHLEPQTRDHDMAKSPEARIYDPFWLLGRQWQIGEMEGIDAGSPIVVEGNLLTYQLKQPTAVSPFVCSEGTSTLPLEVLVESEEVFDDSSPRLSAEIGSEFIRLLDDAGLHLYARTYINEFPLNLWKLRIADLRRPASFVARLVSEQDGLSAFLRSQLKSATITALHRYQELPVSEKRGVLSLFLTDLNDVLKKRCLYEVSEPGRFSNVVIDQDTRRWLDACPRGQLTPIDVAFLNRRLLSLYYPQELFTVSQTGQPVCMLLSGRVPDGEALLQASLASATGHFPLRDFISVTERDRMMTVFAAWQCWVQTLFVRPISNATSYWNSERFEYQFVLETTNPVLREGAYQVELTAPQYDGQRLDWNALRYSGASMQQGPTMPAVRMPFRVHPCGVQFPGMPQERWWAFEDGRINFADFSVAGDQLGSSLLLEFAMIYAADWFWIPIDLDVHENAGVLTEIQSLTVTDSFGQQQRIAHYSSVDKGADSWQFFTITPTENLKREAPAFGRQLLPLLSSFYQGIDGAPVEEVGFARDETANVAWGIEHLIEGFGFTPSKRFESYQQDRIINLPVAHSYQPINEVPAYWVPLLPKQIGESGIRFVRADMIATTVNDSAHQPLGKILVPNKTLQVYEEEIPKSGVTVTRRYRYARWTNGETFVWLGRQKHPGIGQNNSGIRFDNGE